MAYSFRKTTFITLSLLLSLTSFLIDQSHGHFASELLEPIRMKPESEKTTHLHFYFHDILSGQKPTSIKIAGPKVKGFGSSYLFDDILTEEKDPSSKIVGRAQGLYSDAAQNDVALLMVVNFEFVEGKYNGSSISVVGRNAVFHDVREMPIVGGSGVFRFVSGYLLANTISYNAKTGDAIVEYNVYVKHY